MTQLPEEIVYDITISARLVKLQTLPIYNTITILEYLSGSGDLPDDLFNHTAKTLVNEGIREAIPIVKKNAPSIFHWPKKSLKKDQIDKHQKDIFNIFEKWRKQYLAKGIDFYSFNPNELTIDIIEQLMHQYPTETSITSMEEKAFAHLCCTEYENAYKKYQDIENFQKNFNKKMRLFWELHKKNLERIVKEKSYTPEPDLINDLIRLVFIKCLYLHGREVDTVYQLKHLDLTAINIEMIDDPYITARLENPFHKKEVEILQYIKDNHENINNEITDLKGMIKDLPKLVDDFKYELKLILDNRIDGLKGDCDFEITK